MKYSIGDMLYVAHQIDATNTFALEKKLPHTVEVRAVDKQSKSYTVLHSFGGREKSGVPEEKLFDSWDEAKRKTTLNAQAQGLRKSDSHTIDNNKGTTS